MSFKQSQLWDAMQHPRDISSNTVAEMEAAVEKYPYFQLLHTLIAKAKHDQQTPDAYNALGIAAAYAPDRRLLRQIFYDDLVLALPDAPEKDFPVVDTAPVIEAPPEEVKSEPIDDDTANQENSTVETDQPVSETPLDTEEDRVEETEEVVAEADTEATDSFDQGDRESPAAEANEHSTQREPEDTAEEDYEDRTERTAPEVATEETDLLDQEGTYQAEIDEPIVDDVTEVENNPEENVTPAEVAEEDIEEIASPNAEDSHTIVDIEEEPAAEEDTAFVDSEEVPEEDDSDVMITEVDTEEEEPSYQEDEYSAEDDEYTSEVEDATAEGSTESMISESDEDTEETDSLRDELTQTLGVLEASKEQLPDSVDEGSETSATDPSETEESSSLPEPPAQHSEEPANPNQSMQQDIIDRFVKANPSITWDASSDYSGDTDLSAGSTELPEDMVTENLAEIMLKQGKVGKAVDLYQKLMLKYPEKKTYFAQKIDQLTNK